MDYAALVATLPGTWETYDHKPGWRKHGGITHSWCRADADRLTVLHIADNPDGSACCHAYYRGVAMTSFDMPPNRLEAYIRRLLVALTLAGETDKWVRAPEFGASVLREYNV